MRRAVVGLLCALAGCAATPDGDEADERADLEAFGRPSCFFASQANDFRAIDRTRLVVFAPNRRNAYLVRVTPPATDLRFADSLVFDARGGRVCGSAGERVELWPNRMRRLAVTSVRRLEDEEVERLLEGLGTGARPEPDDEAAGPEIQPIDEDAPDGGAPPATEPPGDETGGG